MKTEDDFLKSVNSDPDRPSLCWAKNTITYEKEVVGITCQCPTGKHPASTSDSVTKKVRWRDEFKKAMRWS